MIMRVNMPSAFAMIQCNSIKDDASARRGNEMIVLRLYCGEGKDYCVVSE